MGSDQPSLLARRVALDEIRTSNESEIIEIKFNINTYNYMCQRHNYLGVLFLFQRRLRLSRLQHEPYGRGEFSSPLLFQSRYHQMDPPSQIQ